MVIIIFCVPASFFIALYSIYFFYGEITFFKSEIMTFSNSRISCSNYLFFCRSIEWKKCNLAKVLVRWCRILTISFQVALDLTSFLMSCICILVASEMYSFPNLKKENWVDFSFFYATSSYSCMHANCQHRIQSMNRVRSR